MNAAYVIARYPFPLSLRAFPETTMSSAAVSYVTLSSSGNDHARKSSCTAIANSSYELGGSDEAGGRRVKII